jgi:hypothetical protein
LFGTIVVDWGLAELSSLPNSPSWVTAFANSDVPGNVVTVIFVLSFSYLISTVIIGARRTPDRTMRRHVMLLGLTVILFILSQTIGPYTSTVSIDLLSDLLSVVTPSVLYFAVMALSPIGRVEKEVGATSKGA